MPAPDVVSCELKNFPEPKIILKLLFLGSEAHTPNFELPLHIQ